MAGKIPFLALISANIISQVGNVLTFLALPWFVFTTTGSPGKTALAGIFEILPVILMALFSGYLLNRLGFKRASVLADFGSAAFVALILLLYITNSLEFWELLLLVFLRSLCNTPGTTARQSLVPEVAEQSGVSLEMANSASQVVQRLSLLLGSPLAGFLIVLLSPVNLLWLDAASFIISALITGFFLAKTPPVVLQTEGF